MIEAFFRCLTIFKISITGFTDDNKEWLKPKKTQKAKKGKLEESDSESDAENESSGENEASDDENEGTDDKGTDEEESDDEVDSDADVEPAPKKGKENYKVILVVEILFMEPDILKGPSPSCITCRDLDVYE